MTKGCQSAQVLVYQGLGWPPPTFAHVSLILAPDKSKLSKRHGATSVGEFREAGYLPQAGLSCPTDFYLSFNLFFNLL